MDFPIDIQLYQVREAIKDRPEFIVVDKGWYTVVDYVYTLSDTFDDPYRRECRGIKFDTSGNLLARPFHKFHNWGEKPEKDATLDFSQIKTITDKADGSMIHTANQDGQMVFMTRMGMTDVANQAYSLFGRDRDVIALWNQCEKYGYTPIFEYVGPDNRIVLEYPEPKLILTAVRDNFTGVYNDIKYFAYPTKIGEYPVVNDLLWFIPMVKAWKKAEGVVVNFTDGHKIKIKADDYVLQHKAKEWLDREKDIVAIIAKGTMDDFIGILPDQESKDRARDMEKAVYDRMKEWTKVIQGFLITTEDLPRKEFAAKVISNFDPIMRPVVFNTYDGVPVQKALTNMIEKHTINNLKFKELKGYLEL